MVEKCFHFILDYDENEGGIFTGRSSRPEPDIVAAFESPVAHDRKATE